MNFKKNFLENHESLEVINKKIGKLFYQLARAIIKEPKLKQDPQIVHLLSESYSYYLYQTKNFPWEYTVQPRSLIPYDPILDVATGLLGFSMIHNWPSNFPKLVLSDNDPFIVHGLSHYLELTGKKKYNYCRSAFS